jgi:hypothetical protein
MFYIFFFLCLLIVQAKIKPYSPFADKTKDEANEILKENEETNIY